MINHTITVRNRRIKVDTPRLIQGCTGSDAIILDLDDEWTGLDEILVSIGSGDSRQDAIWDGNPWSSNISIFRSAISRSRSPAEPRTEADPSPRHVRPMCSSWSVTEGVDNELVCQGFGQHHAQ